MSLSSELSNPRIKNGVSTSLVRIGFVLFVLLVGCDSDSERLSKKSAAKLAADQSALPIQRNSNDLDGQTILRNLVTTYSTAQSYADRAVLYLNYRLEGRPIQEPHPFSTSWDSQCRVASRIFNSQIQCDGKLLSCYVFDNETANLDNQQRFVQASGSIPLTELYTDPIVRHFVGGYADLPLDESEKSLPPKLIPPPLSLLSRQHSFGWLEQSIEAQRLNDQTIDDRLCYVVRSLFNESTADIWVDQQTLLLVQISLPLRLMARTVLISGEIENVELLVRFHEAVINQPIVADTFAVQFRADATPVRNFVPIPDPFPSDLIGQSVPRFELIQTNGKAVDKLYFDGKPTALFWIGGGNVKDDLEKFLAATSEFPVAEFNVAAVYSEMELADPNTSSLVPNSQLTDVAKATGLPLLFDRQQNASTIFRIKAIPTVVVLDGDSKMEFARTPTDEKWPADLTAALKRVKRGENVAEEMKQEYQKFLDDYHQKLLSVDASDLFGAKSEVSGTKPPANGLSNANLVAIDTGGSSIDAMLQWTNDEFQRSGNIAIDRRSGRSNFLVFDGWRTVVELDLEGRMIARHELDLPDQVAVSCLRVAKVEDTRTADDTASYALFSVQGEEVFLFGADWDLNAVLPAQNFQHDGIRDVQFSDSLPSDEPRVLVAFAGDKGTFEFDSEERTARQISKQPADSLAKFGRKMFSCNPDEFGDLDTPDKPSAGFVGIKFKRLLTIDTADASTLWATLTDAGNNWSLAGVSIDGTIAWKQPIGSQLLENELEPLAATETTSMGIVIAVADIENRIHLFSDRGERLADFAGPTSITGISLMAHDGEVDLIVSTGSSVQCYRLSARQK